MYITSCLGLGVYVFDLLFFFILDKSHMELSFIIGRLLIRIGYGIFRAKGLGLRSPHEAINLPMNLFIYLEIEMSLAWYFSDTEHPNLYSISVVIFPRFFDNMNLIKQSDLASGLLNL